jgi:signal transduction histidine kinase
VRLGQPKHHLPLLLFLGVMLLAMVQAFWWVFYQVSEGREFRQVRLQLFEERMQVAATELALSDHPYSQAERRQFMERFPGLALARSEQVVSGFKPQVAAETYKQIWDESERRVRMFLFEGSFFTVLILLGVYMQLKAHRRLENAMQQQSNFIAAVTHELKTPLTSIRLFTELLAGTDLKPEIRANCVRSALQDVDRLNTLVEQILRARMIDVSELHLNFQTLDLEQFVREWLPDVAERAKHHQLKIRFNVEAANRFLVKVDYDALNTSLSNLMDNAIKYAAGTDELRLSLSRRGQQVALSLEDDGPGFESGEARRLFDRFYRVGDELTRQSPGTGLGLFIVQELVHAMHGKVLAESEGPGLGARFTIFLPLEDAV